MRVFALSLIFLSVVCNAQEWHKTKEELIFKDPPFAQCHASTMVEVSSGKLLAAWFGGSREGGKDVKIWISTNTNSQWSIPQPVADGKVNDTLSHPLWNPVLFKLKTGELLLFYKEGPNPREWWGMLKTSSDDGKTWSSARRLSEGVLGAIKNKPIQLSDGTIISPSSVETLEKWTIHIEKSADNGKTWQIIPVDPESKFDVIQPSVLSYEDGRLQILCRSKQGTIIESWSFDKGKTWTKLTPTTLLNPNSGIDAVSLANGYKLIVYNPDTPGKEWFNGRAKLNVAVSKDGEKWNDVVVLENGTREEFSYPAVIQTSDGRVHITYTFDRKNIKHVVLGSVN